MAQSDRTSLAAAAPLGETLSALQERQHSLTVYLEQLLQRIDRVDAQGRRICRNLSGESG